MGVWNTTASGGRLTVHIDAVLCTSVDETSVEFDPGRKGHDAQSELDTPDVFTATLWVAVFVIAALAGLCSEVDRVDLVVAVVCAVHVEAATRVAFGDGGHAAFGRAFRSGVDSATFLSAVSRR